MGNKLYVGNLPYTVSESELTELFSRAGEVTSVKLIKDRDSGRPKGFGFVEMATDEAAQKAISQLHETEISGRKLTVNEARPPENRGGGRSRY